MKIVNTIFFLLLSYHFFSCAMQTTTIGTAKKRKCVTFEDDDGYDKEIRQSQNVPVVARKEIVKQVALLSNFFECSLCSLSNEQYVNIEKHVLTQHSDNPAVRIRQRSPNGKIIEEYEVEDLGKTYDCTVCKKTFLLISQYNLHLRSDRHQNWVQHAIIKYAQSPEKLAIPQRIVKEMRARRKPVRVQTKKNNEEEIVYCSACKYGIHKGRIAVHLRSKTHSNNVNKNQSLNVFTLPQPIFPLNQEPAALPSQPDKREQSTSSIFDADEINEIFNSVLPDPTDQ